MAAGDTNTIKKLVKNVHTVGERERPDSSRLILYPTLIPARKNKLPPEEDGNLEHSSLIVVNKLSGEILHVFDKNIALNEDETVIATICCLDTLERQFHDDLSWLVSTMLESITDRGKAAENSRTHTARPNSSGLPKNESSPPNQASSGQKTTAEVHDWTDKAAVLEENKNWPAMIAHCQSWTAAEPWNALGWYNLGTAHRESGQIAQAIDCFEKISTINPQDAAAWFVLGSAYQESGQISQAIRRYERAVDINPDKEAFLFVLGSAYYTQPGKIHRAIECYRKILDMNPGNAEIWYILGSAYRRSGQIELAKDVYRHLKQLDPDSAEKFFKEEMNKGGLKTAQFCVKCGGQIAEGGRFCSACGAAVGALRTE
jgi:tetratricopeptide (TPR) repeat protein